MNPRSDDVPGRIKSQAPISREAPIRNNQRAFPRAVVGDWSLTLLWGLVLGIWCFLSATALARAAFGADAAGTSPDDLFTATNRADNVHEHAPKRLPYAIGVTVPI